MMFKSVLTFLPLALTVVATPVHLATRQASGPCSNFGPSFDTLSDFTLAAYNSTGTNTNSTGAPLVPAQNGVADHEELYFLATWNSWQYVDFPNWSLKDGILLPNTNGVNVTDAEVSAGFPPAWVTGYDLAAPSAIYCGVVPTGMGGGTGFPILAVNGDAAGFYLCKASNNAQENIVYRPTENSGYESCYPVAIQIVGGTAN